MKSSTIIVIVAATLSFYASTVFGSTHNFVEEPSISLILGEFQRFQLNVRQRLSFAQKLVKKGCFDTVEVLLREALAINSNDDQEVELRAALAYLQGLSGKVGHSRYVLSALSRKHAKRSVLMARAYSYLHCQPSFERAAVVVLRRAAKLTD